MNFLRIFLDPLPAEELKEGERNHCAGRQYFRKSKSITRNKGEKR